MCSKLDTTTNVQKSMNPDSNLHDDGFFRNFAGIGIVFGLLGLLANLLALLLVCVIIYFFLAAAGIVPPADLIPVVPYV